MAQLKMGTSASAHQEVTIFFILSSFFASLIATGVPHGRAVWSAISGQTCARVSTRRFLKALSMVDCEKRFS